MFLRKIGKKKRHLISEKMPIPTRNMQKSADTLLEKRLRLNKMSALSLALCSAREERHSAKNGGRTLFHLLKKCGV